MKTMIVSDFIISKGVLLTQILLCIFVGLCLGIGLGNLYAFIPIFACTGAITLVFNLVAYDESNGWESYRLTLPMSRTDIIKGRYAGTFLLALALTALACVAFLIALPILQAVLAQFPFSEDLANQVNSFSWQGILAVMVASICVILLIAAFIFPVCAKFGLTKTGRVLPLIMMALVFIAVAFVGTLDLSTIPTTFSTFFLWVSTPIGTVVVALILLAVAAALYLVSLAIASRLYATREF